MFYLTRYSVNHVSCMNPKLPCAAASLAFVPYLLIGKRLRAWMPIFVYAAPVTAIAATLLSLAAAVFEAPAALLGWLTSGRYALGIAYLALWAWSRWPHRI